MTEPGRLAKAEAQYLQIARNMRNGIEAGTLRHGEPLPSTRVMAADWATSVHTITQAMKVLEAEGLVRTKDRAGRVVWAPEQLERREVKLPTPRVILVGGYAGSGKSELGHILARETGWAMIDKDTTTRPVVEIALESLGQSPNDRESEVYLTSIRPREYEALLATITENLESGSSVIATAPFIKEFSDSAWVTRMQARCASIGAQLHIVWVACDVETMLYYIRHRGAARDAAKLANWPAYVANLNVNFAPAGPHVVIQNSASSEPLQDQARNFLRSDIGV